MKIRQVHLVVSVDLDEEGRAIGAQVEPEGGPWGYSDRPQTWTPDDEKWAESTEAEENEAGRHAARCFELGTPS